MHNYIPLFLTRLISTINRPRTPKVIMTNTGKSREILFNLISYYQLLLIVLTQVVTHDFRQLRPFWTWLRLYRNLFIIVLSSKYYFSL